MARRKIVRKTRKQQNVNSVGKQIAEAGIYGDNNDVVQVNVAIPITLILLGQQTNQLIGS